MKTADAHNKDLTGRVETGPGVLGWEIAVPKTKQVGYIFLGEGKWMNLFDKHFPPKRKKP